MGCSKSSSKREVNSNTNIVILTQETRKTLKIQPNFTPRTTENSKTTENRRTKNPKN